jgi:hypothetical protein
MTSFAVAGTPPFDDTAKLSLDTCARSQAPLCHSLSFLSVSLSGSIVAGTIFQIVSGLCRDAEWFPDG